MLYHQTTEPIGVTVKHVMGHVAAGRPTRGQHTVRVSLRRAQDLVHDRQDALLVFLHVAVDTLQRELHEDIASEQLRCAADEAVAIALLLPLANLSRRGVERLHAVKGHHKRPLHAVRALAVGLDVVFRQIEPVWPLRLRLVPIHALSLTRRLRHGATYNEDARN